MTRHKTMHQKHLSSLKSSDPHNSSHLFYTEVGLNILQDQVSQCYSYCFFFFFFFFPSLSIRIFQ